jgi:isopenicillin N synthase-like dioxygenase
MTDKDFIPKVDLSSLIINGVTSPQSFDTIKEIKKACEDVGFFTVINHGIPNTSIEKIHSNCKKFFSLPLKKKTYFFPKQMEQKKRYFIQRVFSKNSKWQRRS